MSLLRPRWRGDAQAAEYGDRPGTGPWRGSRSVPGDPALCDPIGRWSALPSPHLPHASWGRAHDPIGAIWRLSPPRRLNVNWGPQAWVILSASYPPRPDGPATTAWPAEVWGSREAPRTQEDLSLTLGGSTACSRCGGMALSGRTIPLNLRPVPQPLPPVPSTGQSEFPGF